MKRIAKRITAFLISILVVANTCLGGVELNVSAATGTDTIETFDISVTYYQTEARSVLSYVNEFRTSGTAWYWDSTDTEKIECGTLDELEYDYELEKIAMQRAAEIAVSYSHTRPSGDTPWTAYDDYSYTYNAIGENIAAGYTSAENVYIGWAEEDCDYAGQGHRRNMLSVDYGFNRIGIACVKYNGVYYWAMELAKSTSTNVETEAIDTTQTVSIDVADSAINKISVSASYTSYILSEGDTVKLPVLTAKLSTYNTWPSGYTVSMTPEVSWSNSNETCAFVSNSIITANSLGKTELVTTVCGNDITVPIYVYSDMEFDWSADYSTCTAIFNCGAYTEKMKCTITNSTSPKATCTTSGCKKYTASYTAGGVTFTDDVTQEIPATGHTWDEGVITTKPTEDKDGVITYTCKSCGKTYTDVIPKGTGTSTSVTKGKTYTVGNYKYKVTKVSTGSNGTVTVSKVATKKASVTIPATVTINGNKYKVTAIASSAFKGNTKMTSLVIGSNVKTIGANAFSGCTKLKKVTIGKSVKKIGAKAFYNCKKLSKITIKTTKLTTSKVGSKAFAKIKSTVKIKVPKAKKSAYKKLLLKKGVSKKATIA